MRVGHKTPHAKVIYV